MGARTYYVDVFDWQSLNAPLIVAIFSKAITFLVYYIPSPTASSHHQHSSYYTRQDNTSGKFFQGTRHMSSNMGEKVAQVGP